jgi:hypothetical protein
MTTVAYLNTIQIVQRIISIGHSDRGHLEFSVLLIFFRSMTPNPFFFPRLSTSGTFASLIFSNRSKKISKGYQEHLMGVLVSWRKDYTRTLTLLKLFILMGPFLCTTEIKMGLNVYILFCTLFLDFEDISLKQCLLRCHILHNGNWEYAQLMKVLSFAVSWTCGQDISGHTIWLLGQIKVLNAEGVANENQTDVFRDVTLCVLS